MYGCTRACVITSYSIHYTKLYEPENSVGMGNDREIYIPISTAQRMFKNTELRNIIVQASSTDAVDAAAKDLEIYSKRIIKNSDYFFVYSNKDFLDIP